MVQQKQGRVAATTQMKGVDCNDDARLEAEADRMGGLVEGVTAYGQSRGGASSSVALRGSGKPEAPGSATAPVQRRRVPADDSLRDALPDESLHPDKFKAARTGMALVLSRAWVALAYVNAAAKTEFSATGPKQLAVGSERQQQVRKKMEALQFMWKEDGPASFGEIPYESQIDLQQKLSSATREQIIAFADAVREVDDSFTLGDPALMSVKANTVDDKESLRILLWEADKAYDQIESGGVDATLLEIFGKDNVGSAKDKVKKGHNKLAEFINNLNISIDKSGYSEEVGIGAKTIRSDGLPRSIHIPQRFIDDPRNIESIVTMFHESMHAGNPEIIDRSYEGSPGFDDLSPEERLTNADHFEVVARRCFGMSNVQADPEKAGTNAESVDAEKSKALRGASEIFRRAHRAADHLHQIYVNLYLSPESWTNLHTDALPYWSKVEMLTLHNRQDELEPVPLTPKIGPSSRLISIIDIAASEGLLQKLSLGLQTTPIHPGTLDFLEIRHFRGAYAQATGDNLPKLVIWLVIKAYCGPITGDTDRDMRVVLALADAETPGMEQVLKKRSPADFN